MEIYTDARDGEKYLVGKFGSDTWMLENLRFDPVRHSTAGFEDFEESRSTASSSNKYFYYATGANYTIPFDPDNVANNWEAYKQNGILYNWRAATNNENLPTSAQAAQGQGQVAEGPVSFVQGVCPAGWHIPSDREWNELEKEIYQNAYKYSGYTQTESDSWAAWDPAWETANSDSWRPVAYASDAHGKAMMSVCPPFNVSYFSASYAPDGNSTAPTQGGLNVLLAGFIRYSSSNSYGSSTYLWSSSSSSTSNAWSRTFSKNYKNVGKVSASWYDLFPVRC